jgi:hypothetical protein
MEKPIDKGAAQFAADEIQRLEERIKQLEAVVNDPHAFWANWLRGSVALPAGIGDVRQYQDRINHLETALRRIANTDYRGNRSTESQIAFEALKEDKL